MTDIMVRMDEIHTSKKIIGGLRYLSNSMRSWRVFDGCNNMYLLLSSLLLWLLFQKGLGLWHIG